LTRLRVLVLEDRPSDAKLVQHQLRQAGFELEARIVDNEIDFVAALAEAPDAILADYNLPDFNAGIGQGGNKVGLVVDDPGFHLVAGRTQLVQDQLGVGRPILHEQSAERRGHGRR
jgi:hypothetical protein